MEHILPPERIEPFYQTLAEQAQRLRNPNTARLLEIGYEYCRALELAAPGCRTEIGGSLISDTCLPGHQDIDIKLLVPEGRGDKSGIRSVSRQIQDVVPYQKDRPYGGAEEESVFAVIHQLTTEDPQAGEAEVEVLVLPERVYVGYAKFQSQLPQWIRDALVIAKYDALQRGDKERYKATKNELYAITRGLYRAGYFDFEKYVDPFL